MRYLCSELVALSWSPPWGPTRQAIGNLESIWVTGAAVSAETPIPENTVVRIKARQCEWCGVVRGCRAGDDALIVEIDFLPRSRWSRRQYVPEHFFDPSVLLGFPTTLASC